MVDAMLPGGSGNLYEGLDKFQKEAVEEATKMGFPKRAWFQHRAMGDGALMVLAPTIYQLAPEYFEEFWTKEGFAGADPTSSETRDRIQLKTRVKALHAREARITTKDNNNVDNSWLNTMIGNQSTPNIEVEDMPPEDSYIFHCRVKVLTGAAAGKEQPIDKFENGIIEISSVFDGQNSGNSLEGLAEGDEIMIDNSDYLAMQTFHHHQVPEDKSYYTYNFLRDEDGTPKYPQLPFLIAPIIAAGGGGTIQSVRELSQNPEIAEYITDYLGILHQTLIDLANWVEKGIEPPKTTEYQIKDGQVEVENYGRRGGIQPAVRLFADGEKCVNVHVGDKVIFTAEIEAPVGKISEATITYNHDVKSEEKISFEKTSEDGSMASIACTHTFTEAGTFFPTIRVKSSRDGRTDDIFVQCKNLDKVRVIVEK